MKHKTTIFKLSGPVILILTVLFGIYFIRQTQQSSNFKAQAAELPSGKLYYITENLTVNSNITVGDTGIIFVDGKLDINTNLTHPSKTAGLVFVVKGDVSIAPSVTRIDAVIISSGTIYTAGAGCSKSAVSASQLIINGTLVSLDSSKEIQFCRTLGAANNATTPAEVVNHQPKYLIILKDVFSDTLQRWSEIP